MRRSLPAKEVMAALTSGWWRSEMPASWRPTAQPSVLAVRTSTSWSLRSRSDTAVRSSPASSSRKARSVPRSSTSRPSSRSRRNVHGGS